MDSATPVGCNQYAGFSIDPQILDLMQRIAGTGKVQVIAANNEPARKNLIWDGHGLKNFCSDMSSSGELGVLKLDEALFIADLGDNFLDGDIWGVENR